MKLLDLQAAIGTAILLLSQSQTCDAKHGSHSHLEVLARRHAHNRLHASPRAEAGIEEVSVIEKRSTCEFPSDLGLVSVTPGSQNAGWAMSPDQPCKAGSFCPYACPCGQVAMQWDPDATSYPSMNGGLQCDSNGQVQKPISKNPYCQDGVGSVAATNKAGEGCSFCQTVLPGNEAMLIPTDVSAGSTVTLAIPDTSYWLGTAAHYYVNAPGVDAATGCIWGDDSKPIGNWSPYVAGGNTDNSGNTFFKIGWNPIYMDSKWSTVKPDFGIEITCSGGSCVGLPCSINPSTDGIGGVTSSEQAVGAGGASFCVVTVPKGSKGNVNVFSLNGGGGSGGSKSTEKAKTTEKAEETPTPTPTPTPEPTPTPTPEPTTSSTSSIVISSSSKAQSSSSSSSLFSSSSAASSSSRFSHTTTSLVTSSSRAYPTISNAPHILFEVNATAGVAAKTTPNSGGIFKETPVAALESASASATKKSAAASTYVSGAGACLGLVFAFAAYFL
ncbi:hypothetical protein PVAG01_01011 [Phlyctema vagabunda]|uniref:Uncharacterized protein n=1 Tax=Phlyctema vagabunda TaxID=108571 RepID=A0ABR4PVW9_9HELO